MLTGAIAMGLLGFSLGYPVLSVIGLGALLAVVVGYIGVARQPNLDITRQLQPLRVERGQPALGLVSVRNTGGRPNAPSVAVEPVGDRRVQVRLPALAPGQRSSVPYRLPTNRRGAIEVGPLTIVRRDPLGLCEARRDAGGTATLWVRPRIVPVDARPGGRSRHLEGPTADTAPQGSITFHTLREYVVGDDLRKVHWRTSARTGTLMVKQHVDTSLPSTVVVLDTRAERYGPDGFEEAVDVAASVVAASQTRGFPVRLVTTAGDSMVSRSGQGAAHLLDHLAGVAVGSGAATKSLADLGSDTLRSRDHDALVVVGGVVDTADLAAVTAMGRPFAIVVLATIGGADGTPRPFAGGLHLDGRDATEVLEQWRSGGVRQTGPSPSGPTAPAPGSTTPHAGRPRR